jgi:hypothetical protein
MHVVTTGDLLLGGTFIAFIAFMIGLLTGEIHGYGQGHRRGVQDERFAQTARDRAAMEEAVREFGPTTRRCLEPDGSDPDTLPTWDGTDWTTHHTELNDIPRGER